MYLPFTAACVVPVQRSAIGFQSLTSEDAAAYSSGIPNTILSGVPIRRRCDMQVWRLCYDTVNVVGRLNDKAVPRCTQAVWVFGVYFHVSESRIDDASRPLPRVGGIFNRPFPELERLLIPVDGVIFPELGFRKYETIAATSCTVTFLARPLR